MRHVLLALLLFVLTASAGPQKFFGGSIFWIGIPGNSCSVAQDAALDWDDDCESYPDQWGFGGELSAGLSGLWWETGVGLSFSRSRRVNGDEFGTGSNYSRSERIHSTYDYRLLLGGRLHALENIKNPVVPFVGGGVSLSVVSHYFRNEHYQDEVEYASGQQGASSKPTLGFYVEPGFLIRASSRHFISLNARLHYANSHVVGDDEVDHDGESSAQLMLGYLHKLK